jgi:class 3 adenylate cyclase
MMADQGDIGTGEDGSGGEGAERPDAGRFPEEEAGNHRIGDAERQRAVDALRAHTADGRLTLDEFADLAGQVFAAQTLGDLSAVRRNLPPGLDLADVSDHRAPDAPPVAGGGRRRRSRRFVGILSGGGARGPWRPGREVRAFAFWGGVHLDFRYAELDGPVDVTATAVMGGVTIVVAEGTRVDLDGMVIMGGATNASRNVEPALGAPVIAVHARGLWGGVTVVSKKTRAQREAAGSNADDERDRSAADRRPAPRALGPAGPGLLDLPVTVLRDLAVTLPAATAPAGTRPSQGRRSPPAGRPPGPPRPLWTEGGRSRRPDRSRPGADGTVPSGTLTMMVTDIAGSTALAEQLGDRRWTEVLGRHYALVRTEVADHGGTEIKAQGDGFLVVFPSARRAILAAVAVQRAVAPADADAGAGAPADPDVPLSVRIGLHTGEIVDVDGDVLGQNVVVAVRIADTAHPGEIVVSGLTRDLTVSSGDITFDQGCEVELKGLSQPWRVHRVRWAPEPA